MAEDIRPPAPLSASFGELTKHARSVNTLTDELGDSIATLDTALRALNLGVTSWVPVRVERTEHADFDFVDVVELGYAKVQGTWSIVIRQTKGPVDFADEQSVKEWAFYEAPRELRLEAIDALPKLFEQLVVDVRALAERLANRLQVVDKFAADVLQAARLVGLNTKKTASKKDDQR